MMITLNLQFFGGRGGAGGKRSGSNSRLAEVNRDEKVQALLTAANKIWQSGQTYGENEEETFEIGYETDEYYNIYQTSDGKRFDDSRVQRMVEGQDSGKYHAWNNQGELMTTTSATKAAAFAWGTPRKLGYKKYKSRS